MPPQPNYARAIFPYVPEQHDELQLHVGDVVVVLEQQDDGWCQGYVHDNPTTVGLFPSNYVEPMDDVPARNDGALNSHLPPYRPAVAMQQAPQVARRARAVYAYEAQEADELELRKGDVVVVLETLGDGWSRGYVAANPSVQGVFPSSYVDIQQDSWVSTSSHIAKEDEDPHWRHRAQAAKVVAEDRPVDEAYYETEEGSFDSRGGYHAADRSYDSSENRDVVYKNKTAAKDQPKDTSRQSVVQLKEELKRAKEIADKALAARLEAERQMKIERDMRKKAEKEAAERLERQREQERAAKNIEAALQKQIQRHLQAQLGHLEEEQQVLQIQRWYRHTKTRWRLLDTCTRACAVRRIQRSGRRYVAKSRLAQVIAEARRMKAATAALKKATKLTEEHAAVRIQRRRRKNLLNARANVEVQDAPPEAKGQAQTLLEEAARRIQRRWRARRASRHWRKTIKDAKRAKAVKRDRRRAAVIIQRSWRVYKFRKRWRVALDARRRAKKSQKQQAKSPSKHPAMVKRRHDAAVKIQRRGRIYLSKKKAIRRPAPMRVPKPKQKAVEKRSSKLLLTRKAAAVRIQRQFRVHLLRVRWQEWLADIRKRNKAISKRKCAPPRPARDTSKTQLQPSSSSVAILPIFTTDVAQISQLATLIANSVNLELSKRMRAHDKHLHELTASVQHLQVAIERHNSTLDRIHAQEDRRARENATVAAIAPVSTNQPLPLYVPPPQLVRVPKKTSKLPVLRSPTKSRTIQRWPPRNRK